MTSDENKIVPCKDCGVEVTIPGFVFEAAKRWTVMRLVDGRDGLMKNELARCTPCRERLDAKYAAEVDAKHQRDVERAEQLKAAEQKP